VCGADSDECPHNVLGLLCAQDHDSTHDAHAVTQWLESDGVGQDQTFPAYAPDLNLIENVWGIMAERMSHYHIQTRPEMEVALEREWGRLTVFEIQRLYGSWRDRLRAVEAAEGGPTDY
jgi:transposase